MSFFEDTKQGLLEAVAIKNGEIAYKESGLKTITMQKKPENSRLNIFYILYALKKHTDEEHPISAAELCKCINEEFGYLSPNGKIMSPDTVKRTLDDFIDKIFPMEMNIMDYKQKYGYFVCCVTKDGKEYSKCQNEENGVAPKKYYYYDSDFTLAEVKTLKDAMETYNYFSEEDITEIISKLMRIRPKSFTCDKYLDVAKSSREEDSLLLMNIDILNEIILRRNHAKITYCAYDKNKKLVPRPGYPKVIEPIHLMWSNGYYYLLVHSDKYDNIVSLRMDRITEIEEVEVESTHNVERFNPVQYRFEHPVMYGGEKEDIVLLCRDTGKNYIMNIIVDVFGKTARITQADDELLRKYFGKDTSYFDERGITWLKVSVETTTGGVELWATQYCSDCFVVSPKELRDKVRDRLKEGSEYYRD